MMCHRPARRPAPLGAAAQPSSPGFLLDGLEDRLLLSAARHHHVSVMRAQVRAAARRAAPVPSAHTGVIVKARNPVARKAHGAKPANSAGPIGRTPAQVLHAYGFDNVNFNGVLAGNGAGQTIAIVDAYYTPTILNDLQQFDAAFGLPDPVLTAIDQYGNAITATNHPPTDPRGPGNTSWELETALDVEWAHAIAPKANIVLVETNSSNFDDLIEFGAVAAASQPGVSVVSMSFGAAEFAGETFYDKFLKTPPGHKGVTFVASTGDTGANSAPAQYPSTSPNVVGVGGTSLALDPSGNYAGESAWTAGGGGISNQEPKPSYQSGVTQSATNRTAPDVAFLADPNSGVAIYDSYDNAALPWAQIGGTSLSAPVFAGLVAIANQGRDFISVGTLNSTTQAQTLPMLYAASTADFHDITTGSNGYPAVPGYDLATGLGTPVADKLVAYLSGVSARTGVVVSGGAGTNSVVVSRDADNLHADVTVNGTQHYQLLLSQATPFTFTGSGGDDTLMLDFSNGNPLPAGGASFDGGSGNNALTIVGTSADDAVIAGASTVTVSGGGAALNGGAFGNVPITANNVAAVNLPGGSGGNDTLTFTGGVRLANADTPINLGSPNVSVRVMSGAAVTFSGDQHLAGLTINGATAALPAAAATLALTGALSILNGGTLDLRQGQLFATAAATPLPTIQGYLRNGDNGGAWNGLNAILSTSAHANPAAFTLGYAAAGEAVVPAIPAGQILVKVTAPGDADLSGSADFNDFLTLQNNLGSAGDWSQGDFNYDGVVDYNDFLFLQNV